MNFKDITFSKFCPIEKLNYLHYQLNMISQFYIEKETEYLMRSEASGDEPYFKQEINQLNDLKVKFQQELEKMFIR